ncbi:MAG: cell wall hydrolase [Vallitaleaceae bacterium]|nr:cell wall hydrolase [Vallitaleaceae bacterium]
MNFFRTLFEYLFRTHFHITKRMHIQGLVLITSVICCFLVLGANGYASALYGDHNKKDQIEVEKEKEAKKLEELTIEEEEIVFGSNPKEQFHFILSLMKSDDVIEAQTQRKVPKISNEEGNLVFTTSAIAKYGVEHNNEVEQSNEIVNGVEVRFREEIQLSEEEYEVLVQIVEAETGSQELFTRTIIANVILNRVQHDYYPDTVNEVVFQNDGKTYQFTPILDGRYYEVKPSEETKKAVDLALSGYDNSMGALAFVSREHTSAHVMRWFDSQLDYVFKYEGIEYFTF